MRTDLKETDVDSFTRYEWQYSSAIRPLWDYREFVPYKLHLFRVVYFGRMCLAEPVQGRRDGPPYAILTMPEPSPTPLGASPKSRHMPSQKELGIEFSRDGAANAVERHDRRLLHDATEPSLFD